MNNFDSKIEDSHNTPSEQPSNNDKIVSNLEDLKQDIFLSKAAKEVLDELKPKTTATALLNGGYFVF